MREFEAAFRQKGANITVVGLGDSSYASFFREKSGIEFQLLIDDGAALVYRPDALVRHVHRRTVEGLERQLFDNGRAYSAVLWKCLLRARGVDRIRVLRTYGRWFYWWHFKRALRRIRKHESMPMPLIRAELVGGLLGPFLYRRSRRHARRVAAEHVG